MVTLSNLVELSATNLSGRDVDLCWEIPASRLNGDEGDHRLVKCRALIDSTDSPDVRVFYTGFHPRYATRFWTEEPTTATIDHRTCRIWP